MKTTARDENAAVEPIIPPPARSNAAAGIATPRDEPTWRRPLNTPDAVPASDVGNSDSARLVLAVTPKAMGTPPRAA